MSGTISRRTLLTTAAAATATTLSRPQTARANYGDSPLNGTATFAVVAPQTGDSARYGEQINNGVRAAIDAANNRRGSLDRVFALMPYDDNNLLASGLVNAQFACDNSEVMAVVGHLSGRITEAALQTYVNAKMPVLCPASTYDRLTAHGFGNILRLATKDSTEGFLAARYINSTHKPTSVVTLYQDGDYGVEVAEGVQNQMVADKVAATGIAFSWEKPDFASVAKTVVAKSPDAVFLAGLLHDMAGIVPALRSAGYTGPFYASQGFYDPATIAKLGAASDGLIVSTSMPPLNLAPGAFRIKNEYEQRYGPITPLAAFSYAAAQILISIVKRTGASDRIAVARALSYETPYDTLIGSVTFGSDGDQQNPNAYFYTVRDGAWRYLAAANHTSYIVK